MRPRNRVAHLRGDVSATRQGIVLTAHAARASTKRLTAPEADAATPHSGCTRTQQRCGHLAAALRAPCLTVKSP